MVHVLASYVSLPEFIIPKFDHDIRLWIFFGERCVYVSMKGQVGKCAIRPCGNE